MARVRRRPFEPELDCQWVAFSTMNILRRSGVRTGFEREEQRHHRVENQGELGADDGSDKGDYVKSYAQERPTKDRGGFLASELFAEQIPVVGGVGPDGRVRESHHRHRSAVDECRDPFAVSSLNVFRHKSCRERDESHSHEKQQIQEEQDSVSLHDVVEDRMMVYPDHADDKKTHHKGGIMMPIDPARPATARRDRYRERGLR